MIGVGGCVASHQSVVVDVKSSGWAESVGVEMLNHDTVTLRDITIFVRYSPFEVGDSLRLTLSTTTPDSLSFTERVNIYLDPEIEPRGASRLLEFPFRSGVKWSQEGVYRVEFTPQQTIKGVEAIGINIVKNQQ